MPKVSVIISSYNHAQFIGQAVQSVLDQTHQDFEILIADDASTDSTLDVLRQFEDPRIHIFSFKENRKEYMKNYCLSKAIGEFIAILNSDDYMHPDRFAQQVTFLQENPSHLAVFSPYQEVDQNGNALNTPSVLNQSRHAWLRHFIDKGNRLGHSCAMIQKSFFETNGVYNRWLLFVADLDLWIRICLEGEIHVLDQSLTFLRRLPNQGNLGGNSLSTNNRRLFEWPIILEHFFTKKGLEQLPDIFPDLKIPSTNLERSVFLARYLTHHTYATVRFAANRVLYDLVSEPKNAGIHIEEDKLYHTYYRSVAHTSYETKVSAMGRFIARNMDKKEIVCELPFLSRYGDNLHFSFQVEVTNNMALIFIPIDEPCVFTIKEVTISGAKTDDLKKMVRVAGTAIQIHRDQFVNVGRKPTIRISPKHLPNTGTVVLNIRISISSDLSAFSAHLASK